MTDKIDKFIHKLSRSQRQFLQPYIDKVVMNELSGLNVKPLKGHKDIARVRASNFRIIFYKYPNYNKILQISYRNEQTYRSF